MQSEATWDYENRYWKESIKLIAGVDEVGIGALAGPVVAAAVILRRDEDQKSKSKNQNCGVTLGDDVVIRDSKTLSAKQREKADIWIKDHALAWAVGEASVAEITELNIRVASHLAMRRAVEALGVQPDLLLVDGKPAQPHPDIPATAIIDGDELSISIAAASILAKVYRDDIMQKLDGQFPGYKLASNKGYGSAAHKAALAKLGATSHHRPLFAPIARLLTTE